MGEGVEVLVFVIVFGVGITSGVFGYGPEPGGGAARFACEREQVMFFCARRYQACKGQFYAGFITGEFLKFDSDIAWCIQVIGGMELYFVADFCKGDTNIILFARGGGRQEEADYQGHEKQHACMRWLSSVLLCLVIQRHKRILAVIGHSDSRGGATRQAQRSMLVCGSVPR